MKEESPLMTKNPNIPIIHTGGSSDGDVSPEEQEMSIHLSCK